MKETTKINIGKISLGTSGVGQKLYNIFIINKGIRF